MSLRKVFTHGFATLLALLVGGEALASAPRRASPTRAADCPMAPRWISE